MGGRKLTELDDLRLLYRGNRMLSDLFSKSVHSIRQLAVDDAAAKGYYRFLQNDRVSEDDLVTNLASNCMAACKGHPVVCIQDTTEINLSSHSNRLRKDRLIGTTNANNTQGLGFFLHPSLVLDAQTGVPHGYAAIKVWNRSQHFCSKHERDYSQLPIEQKESYRWIEVSNQTKALLRDVVPNLVIIQDREGDIYDQFACIPDATTDLLIRAKTNRVLMDGSRLFDCLADAPVEGRYTITVEARNGRKKRSAQIEIKYKPVSLRRPRDAGKLLPAIVPVYVIEAMEVGYTGADKICWRLLTSIPVESVQVAQLCIEWYSWRWTIEEVFKILKKEGYNIEASELEYAASVRKMCLLILEAIIQLFLMRISYAEPELEIAADSCFNQTEQIFLEHQIQVLEGKTEKQKNPFKHKDLKRYTWAIARLGGWKGYESNRHPGITTLYIGLKHFKAAMQGWEIHKNVSTR
ncbi:MAG: IS4 family transposase [Chitinophagaceae bacterium]